MSGVQEREIYLSAPVVLVALEVRHPSAEPVRGSAQARAKRVLAEVAPIAREVQMTTLTVTPGAQPEASSERAIKFLSRDKATAITFRSEAVVVETTHYARYENLRELLALALKARLAAGEIDGIERVGLRYIDEIRVPESNGDGLAWGNWVHPSLLGPAHVAAENGLAPAQWQGVSVFEDAKGNAIVLRYGPREGYAVDPGGDLRRPTPAPGPFFLMDIDSFWVPDADVPQFESEALLQKCDELHKPVRTLFESLITEKLRKEVLRHVG
jgi:uncharacterized protein (TIGR04255 family)